MKLSLNPSDEDLTRLLDACGLKLPPECGTVPGYMGHVKRGEEPCEPCRAAYLAARPVWDAKGKRPRPIKHGTAAGAQAHHRRKEPACGPCARAYRTYQNQQRATRKARAAA